jgi:hypothetical protein
MLETVVVVLAGCAQPAVVETGTEDTSQADRDAIRALEDCSGYLEQ